MVGKQHGLGPLQVGVAGHEQVLMLLSKLQQHPLHTPYLANCFAYDLPGVEPHVQCNLVVAGAAGVEASAHGSNHVRQAPLNVHVQVFQRRVPGELPRLYFVLHRLQAGNDGLGILSRDNTLPGQHSGVGD